MDDSAKEAEIREKIRGMIKESCSLLDKEEQFAKLFSDDATIEVHFDDYEKVFNRLKFSKFIRSKTDKIEITQVDAPSINIESMTDKQKCNCMIFVVYTKKSRVFNIIGSCDLEFADANYRAMKRVSWNTLKWGPIVV